MKTDAMTDPEAALREMLAKILPMANQAGMEYGIDAQIEHLMPALAPLLTPRAWQPMEARLQHLVGLWNDRAEAMKYSARAHNHEGRVEMDAYCDGKQMALKDCAYELESILKDAAGAFTRQVRAPRPRRLSDEK